MHRISKVIQSHRGIVLRRSIVPVRASPHTNSFKLGYSNSSVLTPHARRLHTSCPLHVSYTDLYNANAPKPQPEEESTKDNEPVVSFDDADVPQAEQATDQLTEKGEIPSEAFLKLLESSAYTAYVTMTSAPQGHLEPEDRLQRAWSRAFQIFLFLGLPRENPEQFLLDFMTVEAAEDSFEQRARNAISLLTATVVKDFAAIPPASPLRSKFAELFAIADALPPLTETYLEHGGLAPKQPQWQQFWERAQPVLITLTEKLEQDGFSVDLMAEETQQSK